MTFIQVDICHQIRPLPMLYSISLTFIFKVKYLLVMHWLLKMQGGVDCASRFALTEVGLVRFRILNITLRENSFLNQSLFKSGIILLYFCNSWRLCTLKILLTYLLIYLLFHYLLTYLLTYLLIYHRRFNQIEVGILVVHN